MRFLAVCPGGFDSTAARQIADASLFDLVMLVEKSLLHAVGGGRYAMHPLLRQYALEQLVTHDEARAARQRQSSYYLDLLTAATEDFAGAGQRNALDRLDAEADNVRAAWLWAGEQGDWIALHRAAASLYEFLHIRSHYGDGQQLCRHLIG